MPMQTLPYNTMPAPAQLQSQPMSNNAFMDDMSSLFDADIDFTTFGATENWDPKNWVHGDSESL